MFDILKKELANTCIIYRSNKAKKRQKTLCKWYADKIERFRFVKDFS